MNPKYRVLLALLLTLLAICSQVVFGQTKIVQQIVHVDNKTMNVQLDNLKAKDCLSGLGSISISASGGSGKYTYSWKGPSGFTATQQDLINLQEGTYTLQISDGVECLLSKTWEVPLTCASTCALVDIASVTNSKTCSSNDGSVNVTISGGSGSYTYTWYNKNFNIVGNVSSLSAAVPGTYYLEVTDTKTKGCTTFFYYYIESSFKVNFTVAANAKCVSPYSGSISTSVSGGSGNYLYEWQLPDGKKVKGGATQSSLRGGNYILTVQDVNLGCSAEQTIFLSNTTAATLAIKETITPSSSCAPGNGQIDITVENGSGEYTYSWYNQSTSLFVNATEDLTKVIAAPYSVYVSDNLSGCNTFKSFIVTDKSKKPEFTTTKTDNTACSNPFNGAIELVFTTAGQHDVLWSDGTKTQKNKTLAPGKYGLTVTDKTTGCKEEIKSTDAAAIIIADKSAQPLQVNIASVVGNSKCTTPNGSIQTSIESSRSSPSILWTGPNGFTSAKEDITDLDSGTYMLTVSIQCNAAPIIEAQQLDIRANKTIQLNLLDIISDPDNNLDPSTIEIIQMPQSGAIAIITNDLMLNIAYTNSFSGTDNLRLRACDVLNACTENTVSINLKTENGVIVYNAVAPLSSGDNKFMRIDHLPEGSNRVSIFNRWGDKVFEIENYINEIPGKRFEGLNESGKALPTGTYFYKIELADASSLLTGYLSLKQ